MKICFSILRSLRTLDRAAIAIAAGLAFVFFANFNASAATIWQVNDTASIAPGGTPVCEDIFGTYQNSFWRSFTPSTYGFSGQFSPTSVRIGVQASSPAGASQPITVNLYTNSGAAFPNGTLTLIATSNTTVAAGTGFFVNVPVTAASQPATTPIVVEVYAPDGTGVGNFFYLGSNSSGESAPGYLSTADCGVPTPLSYDSLGFPGTDLLIGLNGASPTAASATLGGRVVAPSGAAVAKAFVTVTDQNGVTLSARTNADGSFTFEGLETGIAYLVNARARGLRFEPRLVQVFDSVTDLELSGTRR